MYKLLILKRNDLIFPVMPALQRTTEIMERNGDLTQF